MSKRMLNMSVAAVLAAGSAALSTAASAMPVSRPAAVTQAAAAGAIPVWYREGYGWGFGPAYVDRALAAPYSRRYYYDDRYYGDGYYARPYPRHYGYYRAPRYVYSDDAVAYCASRYRSYDPATGTFIGYDGCLHRCP